MDSNISPKKSISYISIETNDQDKNLLLSNLDNDSCYNNKEIHDLSNTPFEDTSFNNGYKGRPTIIKKYENLNRNKREIINFNLYVHNITPKEYEMKIVNDIIYNENKRVVSIFKDHLIFNDPAEFLRGFYDHEDSSDIITKWGIFFNENELIPLTPNYAIFDWKKIFLKNIQKKLKLREKLIMNYNNHDNSEGENENSGVNEGQLRNLRIKNESILKDKTFTRILDQNSIDNHILITYNKEESSSQIQKIVKNETDERLNSSVINDLTLFLEGSSILENIHFNKIDNNRIYHEKLGDRLKNKNFNIREEFKKNINYSNCTEKDFDRAITPICNVTEKSGFYNQDNTFSLLDIENKNQTLIHRSKQNKIDFNELRIKSKLDISNLENSNKEDTNLMLKKNFNQFYIQNTMMNIEKFVPNIVNSCPNNIFNNIQNEEKTLQRSKNHILLETEQESSEIDGRFIVEKIDESELNISNRSKNSKNSKYEGNNSIDIDKFNLSNKLNLKNKQFKEEEKFNQKKFREDEIESRNFTKPFYVDDENKNEYGLISKAESDKKKSDKDLNLQISLNKDFETRINPQNKENIKIDNNKFDLFVNDSKMKNNEKFLSSKKFVFDSENKEKMNEKSNLKRDKIDFNDNLSKNLSKNTDSNTKKLKCFNLIFEEGKEIKNKERILDKSKSPNNSPLINNYTDKIFFFSKNQKIVEGKLNLRNHKRSKSNPIYGEIFSIKDFANGDIIQNINLNSKDASKIFNKNLGKSFDKRRNKNKFRNFEVASIPLTKFESNEGKNIRDKINKKSKEKKVSKENIDKSGKNLFISYVDFNKKNFEKINLQSTKGQITNKSNSTSIRKLEHSRENFFLQNNSKNNSLDFLNDLLKNKLSVLSKSTILNNRKYLEASSHTLNSEKINQKRNFSVFINKIGNIFNKKNKNHLMNPVQNKINDQMKINCKTSLNNNNLLENYDFNDEILFINKIDQGYFNERGKNNLFSIKAFNPETIDNINEDGNKLKQNEIDLNINERDMSNSYIKNMSGKKNTFLNSSKKETHIDSITPKKQNFEFKNKENSTFLIYKSKISKGNNNEFNSLYGVQKEESISKNLNVMNVNLNHSNNIVEKNGMNHRKNKKLLNFAQRDQTLNSESKKFIKNDPVMSHRNLNYIVKNPVQNNTIKSYLEENVNYLKHKSSNNSNSKNKYAPKQIKIVNKKANGILNDSILNINSSKEKYDKDRSASLRNNNNDSTSNNNFDLNIISKNLINNPFNKFIQKNYYLNAIKPIKKNSNLNNSSNNLKNKNNNLFNNQNLSTIINKIDKEEKNNYKENEIFTIQNFENLNIDLKLNSTMNQEETNHPNLSINNKIYNTNNKTIQLREETLKLNDPNTNKVIMFNKTSNIKNTFNYFSKAAMNEKMKMDNLNCFSNRSKENTNKNIFNMYSNKNNKIIDKNLNENMNNNNINDNFNSSSTKNKTNNNKINNANENKYIKIFTNNLKENLVINNNMSSNTNKITKNFSLKKNINNKFFSQRKDEKSHTNLKNERNNFYNSTNKNQIKYTNIIKKFRSIEPNENIIKNENNTNIHKEKKDKTLNSKSKDNLFYLSQTIDPEKSGYYNKKDVFSENENSKYHNNFLNKDNSWFYKNIPNKNLHNFENKNILNDEDSQSVSYMNLYEKNINNFLKNENNKDKEINFSEISNLKTFNNNNLQNKNIIDSHQSNDNMLEICSKNSKLKSINVEITKNENDNNDSLENNQLKQNIPFPNFNNLCSLQNFDNTLQKVSLHDTEKFNISHICYESNNEKNLYLDNDSKKKNEVKPSLNAQDIQIKDPIDINQNLWKENVIKERYKQIKKIDFKKIKDFAKINDTQNINHDMSSNRSQKFINRKFKFKQGNFNEFNSLNKDKDEICFKNKGISSYRVKNQHVLNDYNNSNQKKNIEVDTNLSPFKTNNFNKIHNNTNKNQDVSNFKNIKIQIMDKNSNKKSFEKINETVKSNFDLGSIEIAELNNSSGYINNNINYYSKQQNLNSYRNNYISEIKNYNMEKIKNNKQFNSNGINKHKVNSNKNKKFNILSLLNNTTSNSTVKSLTNTQKLSNTNTKIKGKNFDNNIDHFSTLRGQSKNNASKANNNKTVDDTKSDNKFIKNNHKEYYKDKNLNMILLTDSNLSPENFTAENQNSKNEYSFNNQDFITDKNSKFFSENYRKIKYKLDKKDNYDCDNEALINKDINHQTKFNRYDIDNNIYNKGIENKYFENNYLLNKENFEFSEIDNANNKSNEVDINLNNLAENKNIYKLNEMTIVNNNQQKLSKKIVNNKNIKNFNGQLKMGINSDKNIYNFKTNSQKENIINKFTVVSPLYKNITKNKENYLGSKINKKNTNIINDINFYSNNYNNFLNDGKSKLEHNDKQLKKNEIKNLEQEYQIENERFDYDNEYLPLKNPDFSININKKNIYSNLNINNKAVSDKKYNNKNVSHNRKINTKIKNKNLDQIDVNEYLENNNYIFDAIKTSKNLRDPNKILDYNPCLGKPLSNKNIQINNNIIINNNEAFPLTMNFNYDCNGKIYFNQKKIENNHYEQNNELEKKNSDNRDIINGKKSTRIYTNVCENKINNKNNNNNNINNTNKNIKNLDLLNLNPANKNLNSQKLIGNHSARNDNMFNGLKNKYCDMNANDNFRNIHNKNILRDVSKQNLDDQMIYKEN